VLTDGACCTHCVTLPYCYQKERQLIPYCKVDENVDIIAVKPFFL